jgi:hypothetical protein
MADPSMRRHIKDHPFSQEADLYEDMIAYEKRLAARRSSVIYLTEDGIKRLRAEIRRLRHLAKIDEEWLKGGD